MEWNIHRIICCDATVQRIVYTLHNNKLILHTVAQCTAQSDRICSKRMCDDLVWFLFYSAKNQNNSQPEHKYMIVGMRVYSCLILLRLRIGDIALPGIAFVYVRQILLQ